MTARAGIAERRSERGKDRIARRDRDATREPRDQNFRVTEYQIVMDEDDSIRVVN